jgi:hypothetical protein
MRTTINLDDHLLADARVLARETGKTLTAIIEDALRERLARRSVAGRLEPTRLPTVGGNGLLPGVDLDDSAALRDLMDAAS